MAGCEEAPALGFQDHGRQPIRIGELRPNPRHARNTGRDVDFAPSLRIVRRSRFPALAALSRAPKGSDHGEASPDQDPHELHGGHRFFYVTKKNARTMTEKMVMKKYDPVVRKHVEFKEGKIK